MGINEKPEMESPVGSVDHALSVYHSDLSVGTRVLVAATLTVSTMALWAHAVNFLAILLDGQLGVLSRFFAG